MNATRRTARALICISTLLLAAPAALFAVEEGRKEPAPENPLQPFERFIGGKWELEGSFQEFQWGVGKKSVVARSYFVVDGSPKKVSEGFWYWHPGEEEIRGIFVAVDMPVELFDYTTEFRDGKVVSHLKSYTPGGQEQIYTETFELTGGDTYQWTLLSGGPDGPKKVMGGTYRRRR